MHSFLASLLVTASAVKHVAGAALDVRDCNGDNCLRAVRASNSPDRQLACSSFFRVTVTPATVTITQTATLSFSEATTLSRTVTDTELRTATNTLAVEETVQATITQTITEEGGSGGGATLKVRQQTNEPSSLPTWAVNCKNAVAFSSACSCLGYTKTTITAAAPSTTITNTISHTATSTDLVTNTVTAIITDATVTATETLGTVTATQTVVTTQTVDPPAPQCTAFQLQISSNGGVNGQYLMGPAGGQGTVGFTNTLSSATWFTFGSEGVKVYAHPSSSLDQTPVNFWRATSTSIGTLQQSTSDVNLVSCSIDATSTFQCFGASNPAQNTFYRCPNFLNGVAFAQPAVINGNPTYRQYCTEVLKFVVINRTPAVCAP